MSWNNLLRWFKSFRQPKVWAVKEIIKKNIGKNGNIVFTMAWFKVVSYSKPYVEYPQWLRGPFRSEVDCDEFVSIHYDAIAADKRRQSNNDGIN